MLNFLFLQIQLITQNSRTSGHRIELQVFAITCILTLMEYLFRPNTDDISAYVVV